MKSPSSPTVPRPIRLLQERHQENLEQMLENLLKDETLSDITIHCNDGSVKAHKLILAAFSPYFKKVFEEHAEQQVAFMIHGVAVKQIRSLIELMYKGNTQVPQEMTGKLCDIAEEFGVKGIVDENEKFNGVARDTRFKGQKRVTVDFETSPSDVPPVKIITKTPDRDEMPKIQQEPENTWTTSPQPSPEQLVALLPMSPEARRKTKWALKQRKYKCSLCPSSFKRASHLSRHQLVHTGERPYACGQCDKAFSRHDKLKHHIRKTHILNYLGNIIENSSDPDIYTMGHVEVADNFEESTRITREDLLAEMSSTEESKKDVQDSLSEDCKTNSALEIDPVGGSSVNAKKGRGRPRKYPAASKPLFKRPRGRPRNSSALGRSDKSPEERSRSENYDITNMPFGDLEYLTKPLNPENFEDSSRSVDADLMEPLVQIELDGTKKLQRDSDKDEEPEETVQDNSAGSFLKKIGLLENSALAKMEIGECTISVSSTTGYS